MGKLPFHRLKRVLGRLQTHDKYGIITGFRGRARVRGAGRSRPPRAAHAAGCRTDAIAGAFFARHGCNRLRAATALITAVTLAILAGT